jgi:hypothetical protein
LYGCVYASGSLSAGAIYYQGSIYQVDAQTIAGTPTTLFFVVDETYGAFNPVTYADSTLRNVHTERKLRLQAGSGLFSLASVVNVTNLVKERLDLTGLLSGYATQAWVTALFSTLRNGFSPTFRINPANSHLEWAYRLEMPFQPNAPGSALNPWLDLGLVIGIIGPGTLGVFEANITTNKMLPVGYYGAYGTTLVRDILQYDVETDPNNAFFLLREYVAQTDGTYVFRHELGELEVVSTTVPFPLVVGGETVKLNIAMQFTTYTLPGVSVDLSANPAAVTIGDTISLPTIEGTFTMLAGDTVRTLIWFEGASTTVYADQNKYAANARAMWRLTNLNWYLV